MQACESLFVELQHTVHLKVCLALVHSSMHFIIFLVKIYCRYQQSFEDVLHFENMDHKQRENQIEFTQCLSKIARRHTSK